MADLNGDGRPDLAYYGEAKDLEIIYNLGTNGWSAPKRWPIDDGQLDANALVAGDLNGDGLPDLVLLGDNGSLYFLPQQADHTFGEPQKIPYSGSPRRCKSLDVDGDGRNDLLLVDWDSPTPFRFRLQNAAGQLGPEIYFRRQPVRSYCADNLEGNTILYRDHRAKFRPRGSLGFHAPARRAVLRHVQAGAVPGPALDKPTRRTAACSGRTSMATACPTCWWPSRKAARSPSICNSRTARSRRRKTFPTLTGVSQLAVADWNGDGQPTFSC